MPEAGQLPVQEQLPLDEPVPYRLTTAGRRVVAPGSIPVLTVVPDVRTSRGTDHEHVDLDLLDPSLRARVRALRRAGYHTLDIVDELGVDALHVEAWVADLPVPADAGRRRRQRQLRPAVVPPEAPVDDDAVFRRASLDGADEAAERLAADPALRAGLALLAAVVEPDPHALVLTGDRLPLLRAAWTWARTTFAVQVPSVRVLVAHGRDVAGDRVAHDVAAALGLEPSAVTTTRDPTRSGRAPTVRLRVTDAPLAGRVDGWCRALLADVGGSGVAG